MEQLRVGFLQRFWRRLGITAKFGLGFSLLLILILVIAITCYTALSSIQNQLETSIVTSTEIQRLTLQMNNDLEKARRQQKDFFLHYPIIGFALANQAYVKQVDENISDFTVLSDQLQQLLTTSEVSHVLSKSQVNLNFYFSAANRFRETFKEAVELVSQLATADNGSQAKFSRTNQLLGESIFIIGIQDWITQFNKMLLHEKDYFITRQRPYMQSAINTGHVLKQAVTKNVDIENDLKNNILLFLDNYFEQADKILQLDVAIRNKFNEFNLQAEALDPVSKELIESANKEVDQARRQIKHTSQLSITILFVVSFMGLILTFLIALIFNQSITRNVLKLKDAADKMQTGDLSAHAAIDNDDEIGLLAKSFNTMALRTNKLVVSLEQQVKQRKQADKGFQTLMATTAGHTDQELFDTIVNKVCELFGCECAVIGELVDNSTVQCLSMQLDGKIIRDSSYDSVGTPCGQTLDRGFCIYHERITGLFPDDKDLVKMNAEGYIGIPLRGKNEEAIGVLYAISRRKLQLPNRAEEIMNILEARITAEIERRNVSYEKQKLETQLVQSQKMEAIGALAGGIAHDFNNILSAIIGYTEMAIEDLSPESPIVSDLNEVYKAGNRAKELVKQILAFSRQSKQELRPIQIHLIVKEALKLLRSSIPTTIEIRQDIDTQSGTVISDPTQIHQITMNLCTNSYHAMRSTGGLLAVTIKSVQIGEDDYKSKNFDLSPGSYVELEVSDTGVGMDRQTIENIFLPYFTTKKKGEGTGLGLSVVHGIVKSYGGHITVYSEIGKGTTFRLYLPRVCTDVASGDNGVAEAYLTGNERALIVDDEEVIVNMEERMLISLGYHVTAITSSSEALQVFQEDPGNFDVMITDMTMPKMSGAELIQRIRRIRPDIPVILCTGFSELIDKEKASILGIKKYLMKPVIKRDLASAIREVLDEKSAQTI